MRIKQHLHITDPERFLRGDYGVCFSLYGHVVDVDDWIYCGEIEVDINVNSGEVIQVVSDAIDAETDKLNAMLVILERRKSELLALTHDKTA